MIVVARFDKTVFGQRVVLAVGNELVVGRENLWLIFQEVYDLHRGTWLIVVVDLGRVCPPATMRSYELGIGSRV